MMSLMTMLLTNVAPAIEFHAPTNIGWLAWWCIVIISVCCLLISAFVSGSEMAYFGLTPNEVDELEESESASDRKALKLLKDSERLLATILVANNLVNVTLVVLLTFAISATVQFRSGLVNFLMQTVLLTFLLLLFGEIFPKLVARGRTMKWVRMASNGVYFLYRLLAPMSKLMVRSVSVVNKIITKKEDNISTDELERALEISDVADRREKEMLEGILTFGEKEAHEIMISRVDVTAIDRTDSWQEAQQIILESGYSRIPVYDGTQDTIIGILYSKDLLPYIGSADPDFRWQELLRDPYFVPESRMIDDLLEDFRKRKIHIAIVVDEYGGTKGIVTLEDIIEEIVGEIDDEYDSVTSMHKRVAPNVYIFDGKIPVDDFCRVVECDRESLGDDIDAETLAGLLLEVKGDFPSVKERIEFKGMQFQVLQMEKHRIVKVKCTVEDAK